ncbi:GNAT family N-acetyltransferase [Gynurincola endophyticus]|uniref:GNAT family N-acetyltransferase n=1 Tax=Gynurincola endophyticus TaxID=2479004 RepID=UPI000F8E4A59|nr:GNAT family N-acetyltransferase [Gynurincola endophyticus]
MLTSSSLNILPLNKEDLVLYLMGDDVYEQKYSLNAWGRTIPPVMQEMMVEGTLPGIDICSPQQLYFFTLWIAIEKETASIIGEFQLKGLPDKEGWVEIGYETFEPFQRNGYMFEMVQYMKNWAVDYGITGFIAETHQSNTPSIQLLKKMNFTPVKQEKHLIRWKCKL